MAYNPPRTLGGRRTRVSLQRKAEIRPLFQALFMCDLVYGPRNNLYEMTFGLSQINLPGF